MKKVVLSVAVVLGLGLSTAKAQGVLGGIKLDATLSNFVLSDLDGVESKFGAGVSVGGYTKMEITEHFALQPEILLHYKNSKMEVKSPKSETDYQFFDVELPVYAVGQMSFGSGKGFFGAGPFVGFAIDARYKYKYFEIVRLKTP